MKGCVRMYKLLQAGLLATMGFFALLPVARAENALLADTKLELDGKSVRAELWGERLPSGYAKELLLLLKNEQGNVLTAYSPSIKGGYNPLLTAVRVRPVAKSDARAENVKLDQQLLLSVGQGDWSVASEFRVLDFVEPQSVRELFGASESMGVITSAQLEGARLTLRLRDGSQTSAELPPELEPGKLRYGGLYSLTAQDVDGDGQQELLSSQQIVAGRQNAADVGVVWRLDDKLTWHTSGVTLMTLTPSPRGNTVNDGLDFVAGTILPRRLVNAAGEATYPVFATRDTELQKRVNEVLRAECEEYLQAYYAGRADMAFKVVNADARLLSLELISGKTSFRHHYVNINPRTGEQWRLEQLLNAKDRDLLPLLNLLCTNENMQFESALPTEWYIEGNNLFLLQSVEGKDEVAGFALGNLHKYILDASWLEEKTD